MDAALDFHAGTSQLSQHGFTGLVDGGVVVDQALSQISTDLVLVAHGADGRNPLTLGLPSGGFDLLNIDGLFHGWRSLGGVRSALGGLLSSKCRGRCLNCLFCCKWLGIWIGFLM